MNLCGALSITADIACLMTSFCVCVCVFVGYVLTSLVF